MKFIIYGAVVPVVEDDTLKEVECMGAYDPDQKKISVCPDLKSREKLHTCLHEMFHATWDRVGLNQTSIPRDLQEIICETFATVLLENFIVKPRY